MRLNVLPSILIAMPCLLTLAACDKGPTVSATNASQKEVAEKVAAATGGDAMITAGRWEGKMVMHELDMPGLPAEARAQMKAQMAKDRPFVSCITEEDVKSKKAFFTGEPNDKSCTYDHFNMGGGKVDAAMKCDRGNAGKLAMTMNGSYAPESYEMTMTSKAQGSTPMENMSMKMSVSARRVGACKGSSDEH